MKTRAGVCLAASLAGPLLSCTLSPLNRACPPQSWPSIASSLCSGPATALRPRSGEKRATSRTRRACAKSLSRRRDSSRHPFPLARAELLPLLSAEPPPCRSSSRAAPPHRSFRCRAMFPSSASPSPEPHHPAVPLESLARRSSVKFPAAMAAGTWKPAASCRSPLTMELPAAGSGRLRSVSLPPSPGPRCREPPPSLGSSPPLFPCSPALLHSNREVRSRLGVEHNHTLSKAQPHLHLAGDPQAPRQ